MSTETKIATLTEKHERKVEAIMAKHTAKIESMEAVLDTNIRKLSIRLHLDAQYIRDMEDLNEPAVNTDTEMED